MPIIVSAFIAGGLAILISMNLADLKNQAATFDLSKLEQMESASVILDRNEKIFGQIYVENRETIPYDQLTRDLINAVVSVEDAKFYRHHGYRHRCAHNHSGQRAWSGRTPRSVGTHHDGRGWLGHARPQQHREFHEGV